MPWALVVFVCFVSLMVTSVLSNSLPLSKSIILKVKLIWQESCDFDILLNSEIPIQLPTCLIHGMMDKDVPYSTSIRIAEKFIGNDIKVHLIKDANHGLSRTEDLEFISNIINDLIKNCKFKWIGYLFIQGEYYVVYVWFSCFSIFFYCYNPSLD